MTQYLMYMHASIWVGGWVAESMGGWMDGCMDAWLHWMHGRMHLECGLQSTL